MHNTKNKLIVIATTTFLILQDDIELIEFYKSSVLDLCKVKSKFHDPETDISMGNLILSTQVTLDGVITVIKFC